MIDISVMTEGVDQTEIVAIDVRAVVAEVSFAEVRELASLLAALVVPGSPTWLLASDVIARIESATVHTDHDAYRVLADARDPGCLVRTTVMRAVEVVIGAAVGPQVDQLAGGGR